MFEAEEEWMSAIDALICRSRPDSKLAEILGIERTDKRYGARKKPERPDKRYGAKLTKLTKQCFDDTKHLYPFLVASNVLEWEQLCDAHRLHFYKQVRSSIEHGFREVHMLAEPDPKPLADMLRSGKPIPAEIRDMLAELLDPGDPEYLGCKLKLVDTGETKKNLFKLEAICGQQDTGERNLFRFKAHWRSLTKRLLGH